MIFRRFNFLIVVRLALLLCNAIVFASIFGDKRLFFNQIILSFVFVLQIYELIRFVNNTNRELTKFFLAIRHADFSITFRQSELGKTFRELHESMIEVVEAYKKVKIEKEAQFHFLQMLVNQLHVGLIALEDDNIVMVNPTAEKMLGMSGMRNWKLFRQSNAWLAKEIESLGENGRKLVELRAGAESRFISVDVSTLLILNRKNRLITVQDINSEIEQKEIEAWHKLIRILTHEIMNSVTPIASLTETMQSLLEDRKGNQKELKDISPENIGDIRFALQTIHKRSEGLLNFIDNYRKLTRVPKPKPEEIDINQFLTRIQNLLKNELIQKGITLRIFAEPNMRIFADPVLLEQTILNLLTNSTHALDGNLAAEIQIRTYREDKKNVIEIHDNGKGIAAKEIQEIFTPFFSTKKDGSGIGLSLSKQIMSLHGGSIKVKSEVGVGTTMLLYFKE